MPVPIHTPRVNNNDDSARLTHLYLSPGEFLRRGDPIADIETDKATFTVEAEGDGYLLRFTAEVGETVAVGSILAWLGASKDEPVPDGAPRAALAAPETGQAPTLKAAILLAQHGLRAADVRADSGRLTAADVERHIAGHHLRPASATAPPQEPAPQEPGRRVPLTPLEHGMLRAVTWQKSHAVAAYLELQYDPEPWRQFAQSFQQRHRLFLSPLLPLLAFRLARIAAGEPLINATIAAGERHVYEHVNLGFTVQTDAGLYVVVVKAAEELHPDAFVQRLGALQRSAMRNSLLPDEVSGATVGFSSMARWAVTRHVPVLLPHTALMVAHVASDGGAACLGATYDHRVLSGGDVVRVLKMLTTPPAEEQEPR